MASRVYRHAAEVAFACTIAFLVAHCGVGCKPAATPGELEAAYAAELLACVEQASTKEDADACRRAVNQKYGLCNQADWPRITPCD